MNYEGIFLINFIFIFNDFKFCLIDFPFFKLKIYILFIILYTVLCKMIYTLNYLK
jgi:hypothetical protein